MNKTILTLLVTSCFVTCAMEQNSNFNTKQVFDNTDTFFNEYALSKQEQEAFIKLKEKYLDFTGRPLEEHQIALCLLYDILKAEKSAVEMVLANNDGNNNDNQVTVQNDVTPAAPPAGTNEVDEVFQDLEGMIITQPAVLPLPQDEQQRKRKCCCTII